MRKGQPAEALREEGQRHCTGKLDKVEPRQMGQTGGESSWGAIVSEHRVPGPRPLGRLGEPCAPEGQVTSGHGPTYPQS